MNVKWFFSFSMGAIAVGLFTCGEAKAQRGPEPGAQTPTSTQAPNVAPKEIPNATPDKTTRERQIQPGNVNAAPNGEMNRENQIRRNEDWRMRNSDGHWWYWGADNRWQYWSNGQWAPYDESAMNTGGQAVQTPSEGNGGDSCGCAAAAPAPSCGCQAATCGCEQESCCCRHRHHHRHRCCCGGCEESCGGCASSGGCG
jgi:hypothetical protein